MSTVQLLRQKYPQDKETAGRAWWGVIHNIAAQYPNNPTDEDKQKTKQFLEYLLTNFVCLDCVNHALEYLKANTVDYSSRKSLSEYFCKMHNHVNERLGKPIYDCTVSAASKHDETTCTTCNVKPDVEIKSNLDDFKKTARNTILSLCKEEKIAPPSIHFQPCPDNTSTSCITFDHTRMNDEGVYVGDADIYINPYSASLRTVIHETKHFIDLKKGRKLTEIDADNYAIDKINRHFDFDTFKSEVGSNNKMMDSGTTVLKDQNGNDMSLLPIKNDVISIKREVKYDGINNLRVYHDYPSLQRINNLYKTPDPNSPPPPADMPVTEPVKNVIAAENNDDFILSSLNKVFAWPASLVGVSPASLNQTYTGSFISNVIMYLINSNFNTFGSAVVTLSTAITMFSAAAIFKNSIGPGDKGVIQGMTALFLTSGINNLMPKKRDSMAEGFRLFVEGIKTLNLGKIREAMFFDEEAFKMKKTLNAKPLGAKAPITNSIVDGGVANSLLANATPQMTVNPTRRSQLASQASSDIRSMGGGFMTGDKNTLPSYADSNLEAIANNYARERSIFGGGGGGVGQTLEGIDMNALSSELADIADMEVDANTYEILQM